jgi:hypothetical protein
VNAKRPHHPHAKSADSNHQPAIISPCPFPNSRFVVGDWRFEIEQPRLRRLGGGGVR